MGEMMKCYGGPLDGAEFNSGEITPENPYAVFACAADDGPPKLYAMYHLRDGHLYFVQSRTSEQMRIGS